MRSFIRSPGYARVKYLLGFGYIAFGLAIIAQILHGIGPRFEALPGLALGVALIALGTTRVRAGFPT